MQLRLSFTAHRLQFKQPSGTSRGILTDKLLWLLHLTDHNSTVTGIGECSVIPGLSPDFESIEQYEKKLFDLCLSPQTYIDNPELLIDFPSLLFGLESAYIDYQNGGKRAYFKNAFSRGEATIPINGLIWMGDPLFMRDQIKRKIEEGFTCIKMKIGAIDFQTELALLNEIRSQFSEQEMTLRVDANGAFSVEEAPIKLQALKQLGIHSIEQPILAGNWDAMKALVQSHTVPIALDEELIGVTGAKRLELLQTIMPTYIILKPSLHGGISGTREWIALAESLGIKWWITSALESNIGLNTIAQLAGEYPIKMPQGLGTGGLFTTNFDSPLTIIDGELHYNPPH